MTDVSFQRWSSVLDKKRGFQDCKIRNWSENKMYDRLRPTIQDIRAMMRTEFEGPVLHTFYWFAPLDPVSTMLCTDLYTYMSPTASGFQLGLASGEDRQEVAGMVENKVGILIYMTFSFRGFCSLAGCFSHLKVAASPVRYLLSSGTCSVPPRFKKPVPLFVASSIRVLTA